MTASEYMKKQIKKHTITLEHETKRNAPEEVLRNIELKIGYYKEAVKALEGE